MKLKILRSWEEDGKYFLELEGGGIWHCQHKGQWEMAIKAGYIHMGDEE